MKARNIIFSTILCFLFILTSVPGRAADAEKTGISSPTPSPRIPLTKIQQEEFLNKRISTQTMGVSTFRSYASFLFAFLNIAIQTDSEEVARTRLTNVYVHPKLYLPTYGEAFETIARQTKTNFRYDDPSDFWVFNTPSLELPYSIKIADGWRSIDSGIYIKYYPIVAPVGMDIYILGSYSPKQDSDELYKQVREYWALQFAKPFKQAITIRDMKETQIDGIEALYFEAEARQGVVWRQWSFVKSNKAFVIVSAIEEKNERKLWPDVKEMVKSFKVIK